MRIRGYNVPVRQYSLSILFYKYKQRARYTVGFAGHMEGTAFEADEMFKEYCYEGRYILCAFFRSALFSASML